LNCDDRLAGFSDDRLGSGHAMTASMTALDSEMLIFFYDGFRAVTLSYLRLAVSYLATGLTEVKHSDAR
jgi:hypothetical protein